MWTTVFDALEKADLESRGSGVSGAPAHCPHPSDCLRMPLREGRSFGDGVDTRRLMLDRYRRLMAQQCCCNTIEPN